MRSLPDNVVVQPINGQLTTVFHGKHMIDVCCINIIIIAQYKLERGQVNSFVCSLDPHIIIIMGSVVMPWLTSSFWYNTYMALDKAANSKFKHTRRNVFIFILAHKCTAYIYGKRLDEKIFFFLMNDDLEMWNVHEIQTCNLLAHNTFLRLLLGCIEVEWKKETEGYIYTEREREKTKFQVRDGGE